MTQALTDERKLPAPSKVEEVKLRSRYLRGTIREELKNASDRFGGDSPHLLKFHGMYQQENRDERKLKVKEERTYRLMVRSRIPGGLLTSAQYRVYSALAERYGNGTIRLTARQSIQLHGVAKSGVKETVQAIQAALLTTAGACGDVVRNVMVTPDPSPRPALESLRAAGAALSERFRPQSRAYAEIWLDDEPVAELSEPEPIYGRAYLPRKFKMGLTLEGDNSIDAYTQDLAFIAMVDRDDQIAGYDVLAGGGMGKTHRNPRTFPRLADEIAFVPPQALIPVAEAAVAIHRDYGDRSDRKHARLKYVLEERGAEWFRAELKLRAGVALAPFRPVRMETPFWYGWQGIGGGRWSLGLPVPSGRIKDEGSFRLKAFLDRLAEREELAFRLTPQQHLLVLGIADAERPALERLAAQRGVSLDSTLTLASQALACPALPTCGLALSEAERYLPDLIGDLERALSESHPGANDAPVVRVTGCPNGCARPYTAEIGIVGQGPGTYALYLGGDRAGTRLAREFMVQVRAERFPSLFRRLFARWAREAPREPFGDFVDTRWDQLQADLKAAS
jgi:sulfite reductase beta subunit-like hemoprotein